MSEAAHDSLRLKIRQRPGMFIGSTRAFGLRHMLVEIVRELLEAPNSRPDRVVCRFGADGSYDVEAHGGMLPTIEPRHFITDECADVLAGPLSSLAITSALCDHLRTEVTGDGRRWSGTFSAGLLRGEIAAGPTTALPAIRLRYRPDPSIFTTAERPDFLGLCGQARDWAAFFPQTRFTVEDERDAIRRDYHYPEGFLSLARDLEHEVFRIQEPEVWCCRTTIGEESAEALFIHRGYGPAIVHPYVNGQAVPGDAVLARGLREGLAVVAARYQGDADASPFRFRRTDDPLSNLTAFVSVRLREPRWGETWKQFLEDHAGGPHEMVRKMVIDLLPEQIALARRPWT
jgi:DNA gyrase subunit B